MNMADEKQTLDDITQSILGSDPAPAPAEDTSPTVGEEDQQVDDSTEDATIEEDILLADDNEPEEEEITDDTPDEVPDEDEEEVGDNADPTDAFLDVQDEDLIEVKIDGKWEKRTIADAKKALSGEGAIYKRLQEATEARQEAQTQRQQSLEQAQTQVNVLRETVERMGQALFTPRVQAPDEKLLETNPTQYHKQSIQYNKELEGMQQLRQQFGAVFQHLNTELNTQRQEYRKAQKQMLHEKLPVLRDEKLGKERQKQIMDAAAHYGFTPQDIAAADDHRLFLMAHDAAMYRAIQEQSDVVQLGKRKTTTPRTLRSGKTTAKMKATRSQKRQNEVKERAKETGKVDDVALSILQPARRRR